MHAVVKARTRHAFTFEELLAVIRIIADAKASPTGSLSPSGQPTADHQAHDGAGDQDRADDRAAHSPVH